MKSAKDERNKYYNEEKKNADTEAINSYSKCMLQISVSPPFCISWTRQQIAFTVISETS